jgi:hypothetical protein
MTAEGSPASIGLMTAAGRRSLASDGSVAREVRGRLPGIVTSVVCEEPLWGEREDGRCAR